MAATLLAAGLGRRLGGRPKAALRIGGVSLLERLAGALRGAGVEQISVVIGPYEDVLRPLASACGAQVLAHGRDETLLRESQRLAVQAHLAQRPGCDMLLVLADLPLLQSADIGWLRDAWQQRPAAIEALRPVVEGVQGHPLLLSWQALQQVAVLPADLGIRDWLNRQPGLLHRVVSRQPAFVTDLDTPQDLAALQSQLLPLPVDWPA
ncbi:MAG: NTP transferase domain-containing protein [Polaromonas sp.]|nr:NTP transferase domain-containing protein [Polaromonas sp.]